VLFAQSVLAADLAAGLSARLDAGLNWDLVDISADGGELVGKRPALADSVHVEVGWTSTPRLALFRSGTFDASATGGSAEVEQVSVAFEEFSTLAEAQLLTADYRDDYNQSHHHSALGMMSPSRFEGTNRPVNPELSEAVDR